MKRQYTYLEDKDGILYEGKEYCGEGAYRLKKTLDQVNVSIIAEIIGYTVFVLYCLFLKCKNYINYLAGK